MRRTNVFRREGAPRRAGLYRRAGVFLDRAGKARRGRKEMITPRRQIAPAGGPRRGVIGPAGGPPRRRYWPVLWPVCWPREVFAAEVFPGRGRAPWITRGAVWPGVRRPEVLSAAAAPRSRGITLRGAIGRPRLLRAGLSPVVPRVSLSPVVARATLCGARSRPGLLRAGLSPVVPRVSLSPVVASATLRGAISRPGLLRAGLLPPVIAQATLCRGRSRPGALRVARGPAARGFSRGPGSERPGILRVGQRPEILLQRGVAGARPESGISRTAWQRRRSTAATPGRRVCGQLVAVARPVEGVTVRLVRGEGIFRVSHPCPPGPSVVPPARDHGRNRWLVHSFPGDHTLDSVTIPRPSVRRVPSPAFASAPAADHDAGRGRGSVSDSGQREPGPRPGPGGHAGGPAPGPGGHSAGESSGAAEC